MAATELDQLVNQAVYYPGRRAFRAVNHILFLIYSPGIAFSVYIYFKHHVLLPLVICFLIYVAGLIGGQIGMSISRLLAGRKRRQLKAAILGDRSPRTAQVRKVHWLVLWFMPRPWRWVKLGKKRVFAEYHARLDENFEAYVFELKRPFPLNLLTMGYFAIPKEELDRALGSAKVA